MLPGAPQGRSSAKVYIMPVMGHPGENGQGRGAAGFFRGNGCVQDVPLPGLRGSAAAAPPAGMPWAEGESGPPRHHAGTDLSAPCRSLRRASLAAQPWPGPHAARREPLLHRTPKSRCGQDRRRRPESRPGMPLDSPATPPTGAASRPGACLGLSSRLPGGRDIPLAAVRMRPRLALAPLRSPPGCAACVGRNGTWPWPHNRLRQDADNVRHLPQPPAGGSQGDT
jgi:hypothetical protein